MEIILTGNDLTVEKVWAIAVEGARAEISREAEAKLEAARTLVYDLARDETPVYGFNRGVGWNKDRKIEADQIDDFNRKLIYSHSLGIAPEASEAEVRAVMAVRLNCLLQGNTGIQPAIARRYAEFLNAGIHPCLLYTSGPRIEGVIAREAAKLGLTPQEVREGYLGQTRCV